MYATFTSFHFFNENFQCRVFRTKAFSCVVCEFLSLRQTLMDANGWPLDLCQQPKTRICNTVLYETLQHFTVTLYTDSFWLIYGVHSWNFCITQNLHTLELTPFPIIYCTSSVMYTFLQCPCTCAKCNFYQFFHVKHAN